MRTLLLAVILAGCVTPPKPIGSTKLESIEKGKTTHAEVLAILGTPSQISTVDGPDGKQTALVYSADYLTPTQANYWNAAIAGFTYANPHAMGATKETQTVTIYINTSDVVESVAVIQGGLPPPESKPSKPVKAGKTVDGN